MTASVDFIEFARVHAQAGVWDAALAGWADTVNAPIRDVLDYYTKYSKLVRNARNEDWAVEAHYVASLDHPNAFVGRSGRIFCVAVPISTFVYFDLLMKKLFCDREIFPQFGSDPVTADGRTAHYRAQQGDFFSEVGSVEGFPLASLRFQPADRERAVVSEMLRDVMLRYVLHHEFAHILFGHVGASRALYQRSAMREVDTNLRQYEISGSVRMELSADYHAVGPSSELFIPLYRQHGSAQLTPRTRIDDWFAANLFAITLVNALWCILDVGYSGHLEDALGSGSHPASAARLRYNPVAALGALQLLGVDRETIEASLAKFRSNLAVVVEKYALFNPVGVLLNESQSRVSAVHPAAIRGMLRDDAWQPFSFFDEQREGEIEAADGSS
jgi:hypothetical protein